MSYEESTRQTQPAHRVIMEQRGHISVSGVESVDSFDDSEIVIQTAQGRLTIEGSDLHVGRLNLDSGEVTIDGLVIALRYDESSGGSLWTRLFK